MSRWRKFGDPLKIPLPDDPQWRDGASTDRPQSPRSGGLTPLQTASEIVDSAPSLADPTCNALDDGPSNGPPSHWTPAYERLYRANERAQWWLDTPQVDDEIDTMEGIQQAIHENEQGMREHEETLRDNSTQPPSLGGQQSTFYLRMPSSATDPWIGNAILSNPIICARPQQEPAVAGYSSGGGPRERAVAARTSPAVGQDD